MGWVDVATLEELRRSAEGLVGASAHGRPLAVALVGDDVFCVDDVCPHAGAALHDGWCEGREIVCGQHGWSFDLADGSGRTIAGLDVVVHPARIRGDGVVEVDLPDGGDA